MFKSGTKPRIDIKDYLKEVRLSQSAISSRNSSLSQSSGSSDSRSHKQEYPHYSQGQRKDTRTVLSFDQRRQVKPYCEPPTQNPSEGFFPQNKHRPPSQGSIPTQVQPTFKPPEAHIHYTMPTPNTQNQGIPNMYNQNSMGYPSFFPFYQFNHQNGQTNQPNPISHQMAPIPPYPYFMYPQYPPIQTSNEGMNKTVPKQRQSNDPESEEKVVPQKLYKQESNQSPRNKNKESQKILIKAPEKEEKEGRKEELQILGQFATVVRGIRQQKEVQSDQLQDMYREFTNDEMLMNIRKVNQLMEPFTFISSQFSRFEKLREEMNEELAALSKNVQLLLQERGSKVYSCLEESDEEDEW